MVKKNYRKQPADTIRRVTWLDKVTARGISTRQVKLYSPRIPRISTSTQNTPSGSQTKSRERYQTEPIEPLKLPKSSVSLTIFGNRSCYETAYSVKNQNDYLRDWLNKRSKYLSDLLSRDARPDARCLSCGLGEAFWKCLDCMGRPVECIGCCQTTHNRLPFHRVEKWTGRYFRPAWLREVGVEIHLGHGGAPCPSQEVNPLEDFEYSSDDMDVDRAEQSDSDFEDAEDGPAPLHAFVQPTGTEGSSAKAMTTVCFVNRSGVHHLPVRWCRCPGHDADDRQLFVMGLFPASFKRIKTAFTFQVLDDFRIDNLECKTAALNFYRKLKRVTSNAFPDSVKVIYCHSVQIESLSDSLSVCLRPGPVSGPDASITSMERSEASEMARIRP